MAKISRFNTRYVTVLLFLTPSTQSHVCHTHITLLPVFPLACLFPFITLAQCTIYSRFSVSPNLLFPGCLWMFSQAFRPCFVLFTLLPSEISCLTYSLYSVHTLQYCLLDPFFQLTHNQLFLTCFGVHWGCPRCLPNIEL